MTEDEAWMLWEATPKMFQRWLIVGCTVWLVAVGALFWWVLVR